MDTDLGVSKSLDHYGLVASRIVYDGGVGSLDLVDAGVDSVLGGGEEE